MIVVRAGEERARPRLPPRLLRRPARPVQAAPPGRRRRVPPPHRRDRPGPAHPHRRTPPVPTPAHPLTGAALRGPNTSQQLCAKQAPRAVFAHICCEGFCERFLRGFLRASARVPRRWRGRVGWNSVLGVQNVVPVEERLADATLAERRGQYAAEVRRLIDAAFAVMRTTGDIDPQVRDIVKAAGLSNQAFYRHFASKDALLLAVLADGQRQLVEYLRARRRVDGRRRGTGPASGSRACSPRPATPTRPRRRGRSRSTAPASPTATPPISSRPAPSSSPRSRRRCRRSAEPTDDAAFVCDLALTRMNDAITHRRSPESAEVQHLVEFCLAGVRHGT